MSLIQKIKNKHNAKIIANEGGEKTSAFLRKLTLEKYKVDVGIHSYGSCFSSNFNLGGTVKIGRYNSLGPNVRYFGANHPMNFASMSPYFYSKEWGRYNVTDIPRSTLTIGNDCWIGYNTIILSNCKKIGNGAVIGAGSIITKDVEPYSIMIGAPAKVKKYRFEKDVIALLEESEWWLLEPDELIKFYNFIDNPTKFAMSVIDYKKHK